MLLKRVAPLAVAVVMAVAGTVGWLLFAHGGDVTQPSAAEAAKKACDIMVTEDYDALIVNTTESDKAVFSHEISGGNLSMEGALYTLDGVTLIKTEVIVKDNVAYMRGSASEDDPHTLTPWENVGPAPGSGIRALPCFGETKAVVEGASETSSERHIVSTTTEGGETTKQEFWVDSTGRPVRGLITVTEVTVEAASDDGTPTEPKVIERTEATYSGFGEPNVIVAPIAAPTPTPTATSTPSVTPTPPPTATTTPSPIATSTPPAAPLKTARFTPTSGERTGGGAVLSGCSQLWECVDETEPDGDASLMTLIFGGSVRFGFTVGSDAVAGTVEAVRFEVALAASSRTLEAGEYGFTVYAGSEEIASVSGPEAVGADYAVVTVSSDAISSGLSGKLSEAAIQVNAPSKPYVKLTHVRMVVEYAPSSDGQ